MKNTIACALCGMVCSMQIPASHFRVAHGMTTKEYRALGHSTISPARLAQLRNSPVGSGKEKGIRGRYGPDHWNWKGGYVTGAGYRVISKHGKSLLYEHRVIAEEMLGRPLRSDEIVHHIDGNRANNAPENLVVMSRGEHDKMKDGTRARFGTGPDCEEAARILRSAGWPKNRIARALSVSHRTITTWLLK